MPKNLKYPKMGTFPRRGVFDNNPRVIESRVKNTRTLPTPIRPKPANKSWIINAWLGSDSDSGEVERMNNARGAILSSKVPIKRHPVVKFYPAALTMDEYLWGRYLD